MDRVTTTEKLLRVGVAFSFIYPPISAFFNPYAWIGYFPSWLIQISPIDTLVLLHLFGLVEVSIGIWILFGKQIRIPSFVAVLFLFCIIIFNLHQMDVLFRDIPILLMALCLTFKTTKE